MKDLKVTIVQLPLIWEDVDKNLSLFEEKLKEITKGQTHLIVLPEMFNTGFTMNATKMAEGMNGKTIKWMKKMAAEKETVITGSLIIKENNNYYNRLIWMSPEGNYTFYDKRHLFRMANEHEIYTKGEKRVIVNLYNWKIYPLVCYDLRFPVWSRNRNDYDCLIYIANWPEKRNYAWKQLLIARAIENEAYVIGVNRIGTDGNNIDYSGDSVLVNFKGEIISTIQEHAESVETVTLSYEALKNFREGFPVLQDADKFIIE